MKTKVMAAMLAMMPMSLMAQSALDAFSMSETDFRGTARFLSMGGAFGALGGDITTMTQNPAGIGVYRSSDVSATLDVDFQSTTSKGLESNIKNTQTKASCNSFGYVGAYRLDGETMRTFNWGISYNRSQSKARRFSGRIGNLQTSLSNHVASLTNAEGWNVDDLANANYGTSSVPWMYILAYDGSIINPTSEGSTFQGLYGDGTTGYGDYEVAESGGTDEFNFSMGGNVKDLVYWGVTVGVSNLDYKTYTYYGESLENAYLNDDPTGIGNIKVGSGAYTLENYLHSKGTGYNVKLGLILRPANEFRIGVAFHTPTYYTMTDYYYTHLGYRYLDQQAGGAETNGGYDGETYYRLRTPWRFIGSLAGVIGGKGIISFDYEHVAYGSMSLKDRGGNSYYDTNRDIKNYYKGSHIFRLGGEYRVDRNLSVRAGYSYQTSPVNSDVLNDKMSVYTVSTTPAYVFEKSTQYITCGLGYKFGSFYADLAYVHKTRDLEYHAFSPQPTYGEASPKGIVSENNNRVVATIGMRF